MALNETQVQQITIDIVKTALSSGAIKLRGPTIDSRSNAGLEGEADAKYLARLLSGVAAAVKNI